jgi:hypothetical protein
VSCLVNERLWTTHDVIPTVTNTVTWAAMSDGSSVIRTIGENESKGAVVRNICASLIVCLSTNGQTL